MARSLPNMVLITKSGVGNMAGRRNAELNACQYEQINGNFMIFSMTEHC